ncbi:MAG: LysM peptidoglycan-binding domain-containing protein [Sinomonas sp.]|nr:LysM peptidoglycan-binding domain-containing protein [Sinomonas sp.]
MLESLLGPHEPAGEFAPLASVREPRLRLTRRGRFVLIALPIFLATVLLLAGLAALISPARAGDAAPVGTHTVQVTVQQGQSLWTVAAEYAPDRDPRAVIGEIIELNSLDSARVLPGQQLLVPSAH